MSEVVAEVGGSSPFSRRMLYGLIAVGVGSLIVAVALALFGDDMANEPTPGANGYSSSAIGHAALVDLLGELDVPVVRSRNATAEKAGKGVLVIAEPVVPEDDPDAALKLRTLVKAAPRVLVVLPRWWGMADLDKPEWIADRYDVPRSEIQAVLDALEITETLHDAAPSPGFAGGDERFPIKPRLADAQTLEASDDGELVGEVFVTDTSGMVLASAWIDDDTELWILTDPGVLNNVGLRTPENAQFTIALLDHLRQGGPVVFDEVVHGFEQAPSLSNALLQFPLVLATLTAALCAVILLWAAVGRFGPPRAVPPTVPSGKDFLIRHTAALLHGGGHDVHAVRRYLATTIQSVRHSLHAPRDLDQNALRLWLERVRQSRGGTVPLPELEREVADLAGLTGRGLGKRVVEVSARIHRWRLEMTHGHQRRS